MRDAAGGGASQSSGVARGKWALRSEEGDECSGTKGPLRRKGGRGATGETKARQRRAGPVSPGRGSAKQLPHPCGASDPNQTCRIRVCIFIRSPR